jgi:hypothetical protein
VLRFSDARNFGRTLTGLCLIAGSLLFLVSSIVSPNVDHSNKARELAAVAANKSSYLTSAYLFLAAAAVTMIAVVGLIRFFRGPRGVTAGQVAGGFLLIGLPVLFAFFAFTITEYEMVNQKGVDRGAMAVFLHRLDKSSSGWPLFILFLVGIVAGLILLAVAMYRTRAVPVWAAGAVGVGAVLNFFDSTGISIVANALLLIGLGMLALRILGMSDEEWDSPRERKSAPAGPEPAAPTPAPVA